MTSQPVPSDLLRAATAMAEAGRFAEAAAACAEILKATPEDAGALALAGALAAQRGDLAGAIAYYRAALNIAPRFVKALNNLGLALSFSGKLEEAERSFRMALDEMPDHAPSAINLGQLLLRQSRTAEALEALDRATAAAPGDALAWSNLGAAYLQAERGAEAIAPLTRALQLDPASVSALNNLGNVYERLGRHNDAVAVFRKMIELAPGSAEAWSHLGVALRGLGMDDEALSAHERALQLKPDFMQARFHRALLLLGQGRFAEGWADYRVRGSARSFRAAQGVGDTPRLGENLSGQRVLLDANQGFGDELFFLRFAPLLQQRGATVFYRAGDKIAALARQFACIAAVVDPGAPAPAHDLRLLVDDLPYALGSAETPPPLPLAPDEGLLQDMRARLSAFGPPPYLGVTWRGGIDRAGSLFKTIALDALSQAVAAWPGTLIALQRAPASGEIAAVAAHSGKAVGDFTALNDDLPAMLALLALLDDYVAVSNTNVHLRAALGRPSRVLVPMPADWRWMRAGEDRSPWFAGSAIYRQTADGDWQAALRRLTADLSERQA